MRNARYPKLIKIELLDLYISKNLQTDCWNWIRSLPITGGYCQVKPPSSNVVYAHRWVYEQLVRLIPVGFELHHTCFNPRCVNPKHLVEVAIKDHDKLHSKRRRSK